MLDILVYLGVILVGLPFLKEILSVSTDTYTTVHGLWGLLLMVMVIVVKYQYDHQRKDKGVD
ncbi:hypothetical protein [Mitsuokella sp.]|uniref:hypothetical protein n=1 Tax=Mitsuokella sp. TaxID=2049034 RepID=UPI003D7DE2AA